MKTTKKCGGGAKKRPYESLYNWGKKQIAARNKPKFFLSYEEFLSLSKLGRCFYCQAVLNRAMYSSDPGSRGILLDRVDSQKHYTIDNVVPCCGSCNFEKSAWLLGTEFLAIKMAQKGDLPGIDRIWDMTHFSQEFIRERSQ